MTVPVVAAFVLAAGLGALVRTEVGRRFNLPHAIPWGTATVNVTGSFLLGLLHEVGPPVITIIGVGGLGALTTFSSFARDVVALIEQHRVSASVFYLVLTCATGVAAATLGMALGSTLR